MIKIQPRPDDKTRTQEQWIPIFNDRNERMISAPDSYQLAKEDNTTGIELVRKDFGGYDWLVTSTQMRYKDNLKADIVHYTDSKWEKVYRNITVPEYSGSFKEDKETEKFLQALFDTKDKISTIIETLKKLSGKNIIRLWTPSQSSRRGTPVRSVGVCYDGLGRFCVDCDSWFGYGSGYSRGVSSSSSSKKKGKFKPVKFSEEGIFDCINNSDNSPEKAIAMMRYNDRIKKR